MAPCWQPPTDGYRALLLPEIQIFMKKYSGNLKLVILAKHIPRWAYVISYIKTTLHLKKLYCLSAYRLLYRFCFFPNFVSNEYTFDLVTLKSNGLLIDKIFTVSNCSLSFSECLMNEMFIIVC